jgi:site-specific recombinase XerD
MEVKAGPDRSMALRMANELQSRVLAIKAGAVDPREARWAEAERQPLAEHVSDWHRYLLGRGCTTWYADQSRDRVLRLVDRAGTLRLSGLTIGTVQAALAGVRRMKGRRGRGQHSDSSIHHHARAIKSFSRWLWRDGRVREDALVHWALPEIHDAYIRSALSPEQAARLITATAAGRVRSRMTGGDRAMLYAVALGTGLRRSELLSLTPESFTLDANPPTVFCAAQRTKNGHDALQPIRPELAALLRPWLAGKAPREPVFTLPANMAARVLRCDLEAAGIADSASYDFHSLRHSYITMVVQSGASVKVCQQLARHADPKLTLNVYSHLTIHDTAAGLAGLAHLLPTAGVSKGLTGTDPAVVATSPQESPVDPSRPTPGLSCLRILQ